MYQLADKNKIMGLFDKGQSVSQIRLTSNVSKSTLYRWRDENDTTREIMDYIQKGQLDSARQVISQFQAEHKKSDILLTSKVIGQLIRFRYLDEAKELGEELLKQYQNNLRVRSQLITIAKHKGDWKEAERLCREILALDPNNLLARSQLAIIAIRKGELEEAERLCREILALDPKDLPARSQLATIAIQKEKLVHQLPQHSVQIIRNQIQEGTFLLDDIEARQKEMQEMEIDNVQINLLLAEAYERQNLPKQTKAYLKKALQETQDPKLQKSIKALLETAQTKKKKPSHINLWDSITITKSKKNVGQPNRTPKVPDEK